MAVLDWELCTLGHPFADMAFIPLLSVFSPATAITMGVPGEKKREGEDDRKREREREGGGGGGSVV